MFSRKNRGPLVRGKSLGEQFLRLMLLLAVFAAVGWGFWKNSERTMEMLEARGTVWDQTETLEQDQRKAIRDYAKLFENEYGLELKVHVVREELDMPALDSKTLFLGVNLQERDVVLHFPPLVDKALPQGLRVDLVERFHPHIQDHTWPQAIVLTLRRIWDELGDVSQSSPAGAVDG